MNFLKKYTSAIDVFICATAAYAIVYVLQHRFKIPFFQSDFYQNNQIFILFFLYVLLFLISLLISCSFKKIDELNKESEKESENA